MAKSLQQIQEDNARMEHAGNVGAAIGTGIVLLMFVFPVIVIGLILLFNQ